MQLQNYISDLLYRYDCVIVPEFGAFVTQRVSAEVNTTNHSFLAPKKALLFNEQIKNNDGLLAQYIADAEKIPFEAALSKISSQVQRYKSQLIEGETLQFKNMGSCLLNKDSKVEFTPSYTVNYLTSSFGLASFNSSSVERTSINTEEKDVKPLPVAASHKTNYRTYLKYAAVGVIALMVGGSILFRNHQNDQIILQNKVAIEEANKEIEAKIQEATFVISNPLPAITFTLDKTPNGPYHIVAGAFRIEENATKKINQLKAKGFNAYNLGVNKYGLHQVAYHSFNDKIDALNALKEIKNKENKAAWLLVKSLN